MTSAAYYTPLDPSKKTLILVAGAARSGTCWVGSILKSHPQITGTIEVRGHFGILAEMVRGQSRADRFFPALVQSYRDRMEKSPTGFEADKSHQCIWWWRELAEALSPDYNVVYWWVHRHPYLVVKSMLHHSAIRQRMEQLYHYHTYPCPFMGYQSQDELLRDSLVTRCARRWAAHDVEGRRLKEHYPHVAELDYAELMLQPMQVLERARVKSGLSDPFPRPRVKLSDRRLLSIAERDEVDAAIEAFRPWW
jgi:hypothetical protein